MNKHLRKLPPIFLDTAMIMQSADARNNLISFSSDIKGVGYIGSPGDGIVVVTNKNGYLRIGIDDIPVMLKELQEYYEQLKMRSRL